MKLKVKIKMINREMDFPTIIDKGDWIDLRAAKSVSMRAPTSLPTGLHFDYKQIPLGIAMELPEGFEAIVAPRSGLYKNFKIIPANAIGVIDWSYNSSRDQWCFLAISLDKTTICANDRICQFRIQLSQKATMWQKIKWLLSDGIELVEVDDLKGEERGGFSSTGIK